MNILVYNLSLSHCLQNFSFTHYEAEKQPQQTPLLSKLIKASNQYDIPYCVLHWPIRENPAVFTATTVTKLNQPTRLLPYNN